MRRKQNRAHVRNASSSKTQDRSALRIAIATAPKVSKEGVTLAEDIRLVKPAILYADVVTLYSPAALIVLSGGELAQLNTRDRMQFVTQIYPLFEPEKAPVLFNLLESYRHLEKRKGSRSRDEIVAYLKLRPLIEKAKDEIDRAWKEDLVPVIEQQLEATGAIQLTAAIDAGILEVDPLTEGDQGLDTERLVEAFVGKLARVLEERATHPLFDDQTGELVRYAVADGLIGISPTARERGKQVAIASDLLGRLPTFPKATIAEILQIRDQLQGPLVRFRAAMIEFGKLIEGATFEEGFAEQVDELYRSKVEPALLEIEEEVQANSYLRVLIGEAIGDSKTLIAGVLGVGIANATDIPQLIAGGAAAAGQAFLNAAWERQENARRISAKQLYFLYRTEQLLMG